MINMINNYNNILELKLINIPMMGQETSNDSSDLEKNLINLCSRNKTLESVHLKNILVTDKFLNNRFIETINVFALKREVDSKKLKNYSFNLRDLLRSK